MSEIPSKIQGVRIIPKRRIPDERGTIYHMLRSDDEEFVGFGEAYASRTHPDAVKAWHRHPETTLNYIVPFGKVKLVLYDERENSESKGELEELFIGEDNYCLVQIPPMIWNGHKGIGPYDAFLTNIADCVHVPGEMERLDPINNHIDYDWGIVHK